MKNIIIKLASVVLLLGLTACQKKLDTEGDNPNISAIYMGEGNALVNIKKATEGGETDVEVRLTTQMNREVQATIAVTDFFAEYNKKNNTKYRMLPLAEYELYEENNPENKSTNGSLTVTFKNEVTVAKIKVKVKPLNETIYPIGIKYAIPLRITTANVGRILSNRDVVISFNRPFKTSVVEIKQGNNFSVLLDPTVETSEFTIQGHFMFLNWKYIGHDWNQSMINFRGGKGSNWWYTRVGKESFQVKDLDSDGAATYINQKVELKTWYQVSYVYKDNNLKVYINGKLAKTFVRPNLRFVKGEDGAITVGNAGNADSRDYRIREVRVWNRALTDAEITDGLYLPVDPNSEGLLVYLPLNKQTGFKDQTKYNNTVKFGKDGHDDKKDPPLKESDLTVEWTENVKFPAVGWEIEE